MTERIEEYVSNFEIMAKNHLLQKEKYSRKLIKHSTIHEVQYTTKILDFTVDDLISIHKTTLTFKSNSKAGCLSKPVSLENEETATKTESFQNDVLKKYFNCDINSKIDISIEWIKQVKFH